MVLGTPGLAPADEQVRLHELADVPPDVLEEVLHHLVAALPAQDPLLLRARRGGFPSGVSWFRTKGSTEGRSSRSGSWRIALQRA